MSAATWVGFLIRGSNTSEMPSLVVSSALRAPVGSVVTTCVPIVHSLSEVLPSRLLMCHMQAMQAWLDGFQGDPQLSGPCNRHIARQDLLDTMELKLGDYLQRSESML